MDKKCEVRKLSSCEKLIMKLIWNADGDIAVQELIVRMRECYGKDYARTTMVTFLKKMSDKGYVSTYRVGRASFAHAEQDKEEYIQQVMSDVIDLWFDGKPSQLMYALCSVAQPDEEERGRMRALLGGSAECE